MQGNPPEAAAEKRTGPAWAPSSAALKDQRSAARRCQVSITESGFALLYLDRLEQLQELYRGETYEDEMVRYYPLSAFGDNRVASSIDTPLHAFLPFPHVDHLHPDWAIALAASANGKRKLEQFNKEFDRRMVWVPWQRPGFELGLLICRIEDLENLHRQQPVFGMFGLLCFPNFAKPLVTRFAIANLAHLGV